MSSIAMENMSNGFEDMSSIAMEDGGLDSREAEIINHLLFHKALVGESHDREIDLDGYMDMVRELDRGMHLVLDDPVDRAIAVAFRLVMDERFDPWNLDLAEFTRLYLEKLKQENDVNFIIAGKLVLMAWNILRSQSEDVLERADREDGQPEDLFFEDWCIEPLLDAPGEKKEGFCQKVLSGGRPPITQAVRGRDVRAVSLMNLIEAFEEAREEIALKERARRFTQPPLKPVDIAGKLHEDSTQEDISMTWQRICQQGSRRMSMEQLWDPGSVEDMVTVFTSSLFLAKMQKVKLTQRRMPLGEIFLENIEGEMPGPEVPDAASAGMEQDVMTGVEHMDSVHVDSLAVV